MRVQTIQQANMSIFTYGIKTATPIPQVQFTVDCTKFRDPTGSKVLRKLIGNDPSVKKFVSHDDRLEGVFNDLINTIKDIRQIQAPAGWFSLAFFDHHGRLTAPAVAELFCE